MEMETYKLFGEGKDSLITMTLGNLLNRLRLAVCLPFIRSLKVQLTPAHTSLVTVLHQSCSGTSSRESDAYPVSPARDSLKRRCQLLLSFIAFINIKLHEVYTLKKRVSSIHSADS